jgi:hypothetical protein
MADLISQPLSNSWKNCTLYGALSLSGTPKSPSSSIGSAPPDFLAVDDFGPRARGYFAADDGTNCLLSTSQEWR